jgi:hypothetical protein
LAARDNTTRAALARAAASADKKPQPFNTAASSGSDKGRITVDLGAELYRNFKTSCAWHDKQMNEVVRELVAAWFEDHPIG